MAETTIQAATLRRTIIDEVVWALGFKAGSWQRKILGPFFWWPAHRFARIMVNLDRQIAEEGLTAAANDLVRPYVDVIEAKGDETIPGSGSLLIVSNHPGAYDVACITASANRDDLKIIASTVSFIEYLPHLEAHLIPVTREAHEGMRGVRQAIRHLRAGGALLIFASGIVDPDPDLLPGAYDALADWSPSIELMLRRAPESQVVVAIASNVLSAGWLNSPITRLQKEVWRKRKLAEFFQLMQQMLFPGSLKLNPRVSFAPPVPASELQQRDGQEGARRPIVERARALLLGHMGVQTAGDAVNLAPPGRLDFPMEAP